MFFRVVEFVTGFMKYNDKQFLAVNGQRLLFNIYLAVSLISSI